MRIENTLYWQHKKINLEVNKLGRSIKKEIQPFFVKLDAKFPWLIYILTVIVGIYILTSIYLTFPL